MSMSPPPPPPPPPPSSPPPPPPPPPSFGAPPPSGGAGGLGVGDVLSRGWAAFMSRLKDFAIVAVGVGVINGLLSAVLRSGSPGNGRIALLGLVTVIVSIVGSLVTTRLSLAAIDNDARPLGELANQAMGRAGAYLGWTIVAGLIVMVGIVLCILPGLAAAFFLCLVPFAAMEVRAGGANPIQASFDAVKQQAGNVFLVFLVFLGIAIATAIVAGILGLIPVLGPIVGAIIQFGLSCFGLCAFGTIYRNTAMGRSAVRL